MEIFISKSKTRNEVDRYLIDLPIALTRIDIFELKPQDKFWGFIVDALCETITQKLGLQK